MIVNGWEIKPGADLKWAKLEGANLRWVNLDGADLTDARIPDHCAWAARGHWSRAYDAAEAEIAQLRAENDRLRNALKMRPATREDWDALRAQIKVLEEALNTVAELSDDMPMRTLARAALVNL